MSANRGHEYFVRDWRIVDVLGMTEDKDHIIRISGSANRLTITCQTDPGRHHSYPGWHNPELGCIQSLEEQGWAIHGLPGGGGQKDRIRYETPAAPGSWTAEDNGGRGGNGGGEG